MRGRQKLCISKNKKRWKPEMGFTLMTAGCCWMLKCYFSKYVAGCLHSSMRDVWKSYCIWHETNGDLGPECSKMLYMILNSDNKNILY